MNIARGNAAFTVDVEDWFHVENLRAVISRESWDRLELRVERNVYRILDLMADRGEKARGSFWAGSLKNCRQSYGRFTRLDTRSRPMGSVTNASTCSQSNSSAQT